MNNPDVIIIGSGIAALTAANQLSKEKNVIIITKSGVNHSNSFHAQGGIAAAIRSNDDWHSHYTDTIIAGCFHNDDSNTRTLVQKGSDYVKQLISDGMPFDQRKDGDLYFGMEGAHSKRRIVHAGGDATGKAIITFMFQQLNDNVSIIEYEMVIDLIVHDHRCIGVITKNANDKLITYYAPSTIIATGGCGHVYATTSNDATVTGDGIAIAYRAGAKLADLEFIQFHPTLLYKDNKVLGLVSEAVRGEGAYLIDRHGNRVMQGVHELEDLAPRDVVARTIFHKQNKGEQVFLNIANVKSFASRFPTIHHLCNEHGIDVNKSILPVTPGAHFMMGGIEANYHGQTSMEGLYALGEAACTGVHGANRLASNSLLEGIVFGHLASNDILNNSIKDRLVPSGDLEKACKQGEGKLINHTVLPQKKELKDKMMKYVGVIRNAKNLQKMKAWLEKYDFFNQTLYELSKNEVEIVNMLTTAWLITTSALERPESRGGHHRSDYPVQVEQWCKQRITRHIDEHNFKSKGAL